MKQGTQRDGVGREVGGVQDEGDRWIHVAD